MANVFGILTAIVLAFAAFVANKNMTKHETEISNRKTEEARLAVSERRLDVTRKDLADTTKSRIETEATVDKLHKEKTAQEVVNAKLKEEIEAKTAEVAANKEKLDGIKEKLKNFGDLASLAPKLKTLRAELEELKSTIAAAEATLANLTAESARLDKVNANYREMSSWPAAKKSNPALKTRIGSIYPDWGFVTLAAGNTAGVIASSSLDVVRDGETIAKLVVTAVEASTASASIVPDSLKADTVLMVGDSVVPSK
jgi:seryl-tRNA synthetase